MDWHSSQEQVNLLSNPNHFPRSPMCACMGLFLCVRTQTAQAVGIVQVTPNCDSERLLQGNVSPCLPLPRFARPVPLPAPAKGKFLPPVAAWRGSPVAPGSRLARFPGCPGSRLARFPGCPRSRLARFPGCPGSRLARFPGGLQQNACFSARNGA